MNIAYIGLANECGIKVCNYLSLTHSVVFITNRHPDYEVQGEIIISKSMWLPNYFDNKKGTIDALIINDCGQKYDILNHWLFAAKGNVKRIIVIHQGDFYKTSPEQSIEELLCCKYACSSPAQINLLHIPALYGEQTAPDAMKEIVETVVEKNKIETSFPLLNLCDALHIDDLCTFLSTLLETGVMSDDTNHYVKSGYEFLSQDLLAHIKLRFPNASDSIEISPQPMEQRETLTHTDWTPQHCFIDEIDSVITEIANSKKARAKSKSIHTTKIATKVSIFLLCFFLMEIYINFTSVASELQFVDMRLIFIAMTAVLLNKRYAVAASILCSTASIAHALSSGYRWHVLFFHVNNWIPIAVYILFAMIIGSCADSKKGID